jgi:transcriptional regulator with XRE-family HTH domain
VGKLPTHPAELPLRQLAQALVLARRDAGWSGRDAARRLHVHPADLRAWEHGRARPGWEDLDALAELYGEHLAERLREREPVVLDLQAGVLRMGDRVAAFDPASSDNEAVLRLYLRRVRELRGLRRGATFPLRDDDIAVLAQVIDVRDAALEERLVALMGVDRGQAGVLRRRLVAAAAVAVVGTGVAGASFAAAHDADSRPGTVAAVAVVRTSDDSSEAAAATTTTATETAGTATSVVTTATPADAPTTTSVADAAAPQPAAAPAADPAAPAAATTTTRPASTGTFGASTDTSPGTAVDDADALASTTPPEPVVIDDPAEAFADPPQTPADEVPPAPVSHDDPAEAFATPAAAPTPVSHDDPAEAFTG